MFTRGHVEVSQLDMFFFPVTFIPEGRIKESERTSAISRHLAQNKNGGMASTYHKYRTQMGVCIQVCIYIFNYRRKLGSNLPSYG
jgi:hypothetical protein